MGCFGALLLRRQSINLDLRNLRSAIFDLRFLK